jgi:hypothetical protein
MSSSKNRKRKNKGDRLPPFSPILYDQLISLAYKKLPGNAAKALPYFIWIDGVLKKKSGDDYNGIFDFTYSEAEKYDFARRTFSRIITNLNAKGFIDIVKQGGKRSCGMSNSKYKLSERWRDYGKSAFIKRPRYPSEPPS